MLVIDLSHLEFIRISGPDAEKFLQGQVSCDMTQVTLTSSRRGVLCNLKGRVIADFRIVRYNDDYLLQTQPGMAQKILDTLARYAVFSKVELVRDDSITKVLGVIDANVSDFGAIKLPTTANAATPLQDAVLLNADETGARLEFWCTGEHPLAQQIQKAGQAGNQQDWLREELRAGILHVNESDSEEFTPQLLNYDIAGVIDFRKGCYTGQEVVARMFYRATPKKRLYLLSTKEPIPSSADLMLRIGDAELPVQPMSVVEGVDEPNYMMAVLPTEAETAELALASAPGEFTAVKLEPLPYTNRQGAGA
ncbi:MAG: hypothetical protein RKH07_04840 [Gammaproteobacteria bacterium]